ncbi:MAG: NAD(P)-binding protein [Gemmatimonadota bacterium]|nr:NAD(P)-binding protein [Gemmatimonadota bacterium]
MSRTRIAILGSGPTGLEASLAAAEAGLDFTVLEMASEPAGNVGSWGHVRLFTPWSMNASARAFRSCLSCPP